MAHDVSSLLYNVKLFQSLPDSQVAFTDQDLVILMNYELQNTITPLVLELKEEHLVVTKIFDFSNQSTSQITFDIPSEATGLRLRYVNYVDQNGYFYNLPRLAPETIASYGNWGAWNNTMFAGTMSNFFGYFIQGNQIKFYPQNILNNSIIRFTYHRRLNDLCLTTDAGQITEINGDYVTVANVNTTWNTGTFVDCISQNPPYYFVTDLDNNGANLDNFESPSTLTSIGLVNVSGTTLQFPAGLANYLTVGDWISTSGTSPFIQYLPQEVEGALIQVTSIKVLEALEDTEGQKNAIAKYQQMTNDLKTMLSPRVEGAAKKLYNPNSILSSSRARGTRFIV